MSSAPAELCSQISPSLYPAVENYWTDWLASCETGSIQPAAELPLARLGYTWACSDFVARNCIRYPAMLLQLLSQGMAEPRCLEHYTAAVEKLSSQSQDEVQWMRRLREYRQQEMVRIAWRDLNGLAEVSTILQELSELAEAFVSVCMRLLERQQAEVYGMPVNSHGEEQSLLVFAMGKMGGGELNFSSDIDLIFCYAEDGETSGRRRTSYYEFYLGVIRKLVKLLDEVTVDGFVYRVDTRLRPFGKSGPMAMSFSGLEQYYQLHGRDWERYAMIKAKPITGSEQDHHYLRALLSPFVYRRYLDFSMIDEIREMKSMINAQMRRKGMHNNIKLGRGGIREIEFIGQTLQLIRAGREPELRERSIIKVLQLLAEKSYLGTEDVDSLIAAYWFLRKLENRLQMLGDKQTHSLPDDELGQQRICQAMCMADWSALIERLAEHQQKVDAVFQNLISSETDETKDEVSVFAVYWSDTEKHADENDAAYEAIHQYLTTLGYQQADQVIKVLAELHASSAIKHLSSDSLRLMTRLLESLVEKIADYPAQLELLERVCRILKALAGRKVYLSLLNEYPVIQLQMLTLCAASEWFTERLLRYPILLDSLLSTAEGFRHRYDIRELLALELKRIAGDSAGNSAGDDQELLMERMRQFKRQMVFTIAMLDVFYGEKVETVSDKLTELANVLLEKILDYSWQAMVERYGEPQCIVDDKVFMPSMAIIAYGKMGGNELGYGSDLDFIFIHNSQGEKQYTSGEKSLDNQQFFARVAQRVIHFLNTRSYSGILYEADTRLRPDGQAGLMVSSISAFESYQREKAWTWEHQALIRARFVTDNSQGDDGQGDNGGGDDGRGDNRPGGALIEQEFDRIRSSVLRQKREPSRLLLEVVEMREKMREHLADKSAGFDIKQDAGGLVDIEFVTQAGILLHAKNCPGCIRHTATLALIDELVKVDWFSPQDAGQLSEAYRLFRQMKNWQNLQCDIGSLASAEEIEKHRDNVKAVWQRLMPDRESLK